MGSSNQFHILFERSGGFAGMVMTTEIKSDTMAIDEAKKISSLIEASGFFSMTEELKSDASMPDAFTYKLTIKMSGKSRTMEFGESAINTPMRPLIDELTRRARRK